MDRESTSSMGRGRREMRYKGAVILIQKKVHMERGDEIQNEIQKIVWIV